MAIDSDAIVIVERNELSQAKVPSIGACLMGDALLHATVAKDAVCVVVNQWHVRLVVHSRQVGLHKRVKGNSTQTQRQSQTIERWKKNGKTD